MRPFYAAPQPDMGPPAVEQLLQALQTSPAVRAPSSRILRPEIESFPRNFQPASGAPTSLRTPQASLVPTPRPAYTPPRKAGAGVVRPKGLAGGFASRSTSFPKGMTQRMGPGGMAGGVGAA